MKIVGVLLFEDFETLDVFGPVEIFGRLQELFIVKFYSLYGGLIGNSHGVALQTEELENLSEGIDIFLIPGGYGTRKEVDNVPLIDSIRVVAENSNYVLSVCTGSALLAKTGHLDGRRATSNKRAYPWVIGQSDKVDWKKDARWTSDGKYYTSSGVSAGMDMALGFLSDHYGYEIAKKLAIEIEYNWSEDKRLDPFSKYYEN